MFVAITNAFLVVFFLSVAGKWWVTGYSGQIAGQFTILLPLFVFSYLSIIGELKRNTSNAPARPKRTTVSQDKLWLDIKLHKVGRYQAVFLSWYLLLVVIGLFRSVGASERFTFTMMAGRAISLLAMTLTSYFVIRVNGRYGKIDRVWTMVIVGLGLYVILNVVGWILDIRNPFVESLYLIRTDTLLSFWKTRVSFPFAANHQSFATEAGLLAVVVIARLCNPQRRHTSFYILLLLLFVLVGIAANVRTPFMAVMGVVVFNLALKRVGRRLVLLMLGFLLILPFIVSYLDFTPWLNSLGIDLTFLTRKNDLKEIATFNNRTIAWRYTFEELTHFKLIHIVGFGAFGQVRSGLSELYAWMWRNPELITLHNAFMQHLVDFGYLGLVAFLAIITNALVVFGRLYARKGERQSAQGLYPPLFALEYLVFCSLLSVSITFNQTILFFVFLLINFQVILQRAKSENTFQERSEARIVCSDQVVVLRA